MAAKLTLDGEKKTARAGDRHHQAAKWLISPPARVAAHWHRCLDNDAHKGAQSTAEEQQFRLYAISAASGGTIIGLFFLPGSHHADFYILP